MLSGIPQGISQAIRIPSGISSESSPRFFLGISQGFTVIISPEIFSAVSPKNPLRFFSAIPPGTSSETSPEITSEIVNQELFGTPQGILFQDV